MSKQESGAQTPVERTQAAFLRFARGVLGVTKDTEREAAAMLDLVIQAVRAEAVTGGTPQERMELVETILASEDPDPKTITAALHGLAAAAAAAARSKALEAAAGVVEHEDFAITMAAHPKKGRRVDLRTLAGRIRALEVSS